MNAWMKAFGCVAVFAGLQSLCACTSERVIGEQCPGPLDPRATVEGTVTDPSMIGTGCAPCDGHVRLGADGCPIYVTVESCGGDICVGGQRVSGRDASVPDAGEQGDAGDESDAGAMEDLDAG